MDAEAGGTAARDGRSGPPDGEGGSGLPASIEAAWGLRTRPAKGPKPGLSLERIVEAAIHVARTDGLAAVSMGRVAKELGASAMSLYRYVAAKDELLLLMIDAAAGAPPVPPEDADWRAGLTHWAWSYLEVLRRDPWVLRVPIEGPPVTPNQLLWLERGLSALRGTGLGEGAKMSVMLLLSGFVRNDVGLALSVREAQAKRSAAYVPMPGYGRLLERLADAERFPELTAVIASGVLDDADGPDDEFVFGLERVLDGVEVLVRARAGGER